jgi:hypothetical protein
LTPFATTSPGISTWRCSRRILRWTTDFPDDRLRLIFICCHPALPADAQAAMALREVCGLTTEQIAAAFLTSPPTIAQRIDRAKARIRDLALPYVVPGAEELEQRTEGVLRVIYLIFTEGYANPERGGEVAGLLALIARRESCRSRLSCASPNPYTADRAASQITHQPIHLRAVGAKRDMWTTLTR